MTRPIRIDTLRLFDAAMIHWLRDSNRGIQVLNKDNVHVAVPTILSTPERAFSRMAAVLGLIKSKEDESKILSDTSLVPTPFISTYRQNFRFDTKRRQTRQWRQIKHADEGKKFGVRAQHPRPWNFDYQIDFWSRYRADADSILFQILQWPNEIIYMVADFLEPWGEKLIPIFVRDVVENTNLDPDTNDRVWRYTVSCTVEAWLFEGYISLDHIPTNAQDRTAYTKRSRTMIKTILDFEAGTPEDPDGHLWTTVLEGDPNDPDGNLAELFDQIGQLGDD